MPMNIAPSPPRLLPWLGIAAFWLGVALLCGWLTSDAVQFGWIYEENGPIEIFETVINCVIALVFLIRALRNNDMISAWSVVFAAAFLAAGLHEFPRCGSFYEGNACIASSTKQLLFGAIAAIALVGLLYKRQNLIESLHPRWTFLFWPLGFTALFFGAGQLVEKANLVSYEEFLEFSGCMVALSLAIWLLRRT